MEGGFSCFNKFIIVWALVNFVLKLIHSLTTVIFQPINRLDPDPSFYMQFWYLFLSRTATYVIDFLNMVTLLYLFYCQSMVAERVKDLEKQNELNMGSGSDSFIAKSPE